MAKVEKREKGGWVFKRKGGQEEKSLRSRDLVRPRPLTASRSQAGTLLAMCIFCKKNAWRIADKIHCTCIYILLYSLVLQRLKQSNHSETRERALRVSDLSFSA